MCNRNPQKVCYFLPFQHDQQQKTKHQKIKTTTLKANKKKTTKENRKSVENQQKLNKKDEKQVQIYEVHRTQKQTSI